MSSKTTSTPSFTQSPLQEAPGIEHPSRPGAAPFFAWSDPRAWGRLLARGALLWAIPFLISIPFFNRAGELQIDLFAFKSLMGISGSLAGVLLLLRYLGREFARRPAADFWRCGLFTGAIWLLINWGLDFLILLPLNGQSPEEYMLRIGFGYLSIPIVATGIGRALSAHSSAAPDSPASPASPASL
ncbi:MAG: hypothetical protein NXI24_16635 [bacterium]|nr:hypothetical protein [bacterium]